MPQCNSKIKTIQIYILHYFKYIILIKTIRNYVYKPHICMSILDKNHKVLGTIVNCSRFTEMLKCVPKPVTSDIFTSIRVGVTRRVIDHAYKVCSFSATRYNITHVLLVTQSNE